VAKNQEWTRQVGIEPTTQRSRHLRAGQLYPNPKAEATPPPVPEMITVM
jgi:hypothetical protein